MLGKTKIFVISVKGMKCNNCRAFVEKAILSVKGVKTVKIGEDSKTVSVTAKESVSLNTVKSAVVSAGYEVE